MKHNTELQELAKAGGRHYEIARVLITSLLDHGGTLNDTKQLLNPAFAGDIVRVIQGDARIVGHSEIEHAYQAGVLVGQVDMALKEEDIMRLVTMALNDQHRFEIRMAVAAKVNFQRLIIALSEASADARDGWISKYISFIAMYNSMPMNILAGLAMRTENRMIFNYILEALRDKWHKEAHTLGKIIDAGLKNSLGEEIAKLSLDYFDKRGLKWVSRNPSLSSDLRAWAKERC